MVPLGGGDDLVAFRVAPGPEAASGAGVGGYLSGGQLAVPEGLAVQEPEQNGLEDVGVVPVVDPELDFGQVGVRVLGADLVHGGLQGVSRGSSS